MSPLPENAQPHPTPSGAGTAETSSNSALLTAPLYQQLISDFEEIQTYSKPIEREYILLEKAKAFESAHGLSPEEYNHLFEVYLADILTPGWLEQLVIQSSRLEPLARIFQTLASLAIIVSAFQLVIGIQERRSQLLTERWMTLDSGLRAGGASREALEYLHDHGELLSNVSLVDVQLSRLNLPEQLPSKAERQYMPPNQRNQMRGARLQEATFSGSNLYHAYFQGANLYRGDFSSIEKSQTNLDGVNFRNADLRQANFRGASLKNACFQGANLEEADFTGALLGNTDFRGARFLTRSQIQAADSRSGPAYYDAVLNAELGLSAASPPRELASCQMEPRKLSWWQSLLRP